MAMQGFGHFFIGPVGSMSIHVEQNMGMLDLIGRSLPMPGQVEEFLAFVVCEAHNIGLVHVDSSIPHPGVNRGIGMNR
jgi:hypothetical protein